MLPGVILIESVRFALESCCERKFEIVAVLPAQFTKEVLPDDEIEISASLDDQEDSL